MNDRHPAGDPFPADPGAEYSYAPYETANYEQSAYGSYGNAGYAEGGDSWSTGAYGTSAAAHYGDGDPLFGAVPGGQDLSTGTYPSAPYGSYETGAYDTTGYDGHGYDANGYGTGTYDAHAYGTGSYDTTGWDGNSWDGGNGWDHNGADHQNVGFIPHQPGPDQAEHGWSTPAEGTAQWDVNAFEASSWDGAAYGHADTSAAAHDSGGYDPGTYEATPYDAVPYGTGGYDDSGWAHGYATPGAADGEAAFHDQPTASFDAYDAHSEADAGTNEADPYPADAYPADPYPADPYAADAYGEPVPIPGSEADPEPGAAVHGPPGRSRRRSPKPRRSALLTVAAPSVAVLGVAGIAAASVLPSPDEETAQAAAPDTTEVKVSPANNKLDTQLAGLREAGDDFADRASRTQERIDLKKRQEAERKRKAAEAARREALRPKFALPVEGAGISAYFGQAGINWMSVHTGLDFPVSYGTPVKAATDGTVRTQWNPAYGNMMIVTSPDGTETWYCHLSSTRIRSGSVQAGDVIGYSGNSGNSTGPHLHFEVRPGGGSAIDPLAWFRSHGLEPV